MLSDYAVDDHSGQEQDVSMTIGIQDEKLRNAKLTPNRA